MIFPWTSLSLSPFLYKNFFYFVYINSHHHHFTIFSLFSLSLFCRSIFQKLKSILSSRNKCNFWIYVLVRWGGERKRRGEEISLRFMSMKSSGKIAKQHEITFIMLIYWSPPSSSSSAAHIHRTFICCCFFDWNHRQKHLLCVYIRTFWIYFSLPISPFFRCCAARNFHWWWRNNFRW
jgi:hypothetical protein